MSRALKRIEERHWPVGGLRYCGGCRDAHMRDGPCDVVKLARALDDAIEALKRHGIYIEAEQAERTLEGVAGREMGLVEEARTEPFDGRDGEYLEEAPDGE
jgi:hypothetical protein